MQLSVAARDLPKVFIEINMDKTKESSEDLGVDLGTLFIFSSYIIKGILEEIIASSSV